MRDTVMEMQMISKCIMRKFGPLIEPLMCLPNQHSHEVLPAEAMSCSCGRSEWRSQPSKDSFTVQ